jgi:hypothetical protein
LDCPFRRIYRGPSLKARGNTVGARGEGKLNTKPLRGGVTTQLTERGESGKLNMVHGGLNDPLAMRTVIATVRPDRNFHLAAQSFVSVRHSIIVKREVGM